MTTPATPSDPKPSGDDRNLVPAGASTAVSAEEQFEAFWARNRTLIYGATVVALVAVLAKFGWDFMQRQKHEKVEAAYAAATTPEQVKSFATANTDHILGGVAQLRVADDAYAAAKYAEAQSAYEKAISQLGSGPLVSRAKLGKAMSKALGGKTAEGTTELKAIADDTNEAKAVRIEAAYHLTSLSVEAGNAADAEKYSTQVSTLDENRGSPWARRAMQLRQTLPPSAAVAPAPADAAKKQDAPGIQVKVPGTK